MNIEGQPQRESPEKMTKSNNDSEQKEKHFEYYFFPDEKQRILLGEAIEKVIDRVEKVNKTTDKKGDIPNVIFLDKSARPLVATFREMWTLKHPEREQPHVSFLNIGRELLEWDYWGKEKHFRMTPEIEKEIESIKKLYTYLKEAVPGSTVVIVDDVSHTGSSQKAALEILSKAFPDLKFDYQFLVKARKKSIDIKDYDKDNPNLFDCVARDFMGSGDEFLTTAPPWKDLGWSGKAPEGVTGVMDDVRPDKERRESYEKNKDNRSYRYVEKTSLTSVPYRKHEKYSNDAKAETLKYFSEYKEEMENALALATEGCKEIIEWEPSIKDDGSKKIKQLLEQIRQLKERSKTFLGNVKNVEKIGIVSLYEMIPSILSIFKEQLYTSSLNEPLIKKEVWDKLGIKGIKDILNPWAYLIFRKNSIGDKIDSAKGMLLDISDRERFEERSKEVRIDELTQSLRHEMKQIADEYWVQRNKE